MVGIIQLFDRCKGRNFNIHIWAFQLFHLLRNGNQRLFFLLGKELISCLSLVNSRVFHENCVFDENRDRIYTELSFINP